MSPLSPSWRAPVQKTFKRLVEATQVPPSPPDKVLLFHGLSSGAIDTLMVEGIRVPTGDVKEFMATVALEYLRSFGWADPLPGDIVDYIEGNVEQARRAASGITEKEDRCIYLSYSYEVSAQYAGGSGEAWDWAVHKAWVWGKNKKVIPSGTPSPDRYSKNLPLVISVMVPIEYTSVNMQSWEAKYGDYLWSHWSQGEPIKGGPKDDEPFQTWYFNSMATRMYHPNGEVRYYKDITPNEIMWGIPNDVDARNDAVKRIIGV